jgi:hypothetical protein
MPAAAFDYHSILSPFRPFGVASGTEPDTDVAPDLYAAIVAAFEASTLPGTIPGGIATTRVADAITLPVVCLNERGSSTILRTPSRTAATLTLDHFDAWFLDAGPFPFQRGHASQPEQSGEPAHGRDPSRSRNGADAFYQERSYTLHVVRARSR